MTVHHLDPNLKAVSVSDVGACSLCAVTPSAPNMLTVWSVGADSVTLNWYKPYSDGSGDITKYVIMRRQMPGGPWEEVGSVNGRATTYTVVNLREGAAYCFAVYAINKMGEGDVMETSTPVVARRGAGTCSVYMFMVLFVC